MSGPPLRLYSVGHSNHVIDHFLSLLRRHRVDLLVDVRSSPWSRYAPQFNRAALEEAVNRADVGYLFLGKELGGRPEGAWFFDADGHVHYDRVASTATFAQGIEKLVQEAGTRVVAMMCSEEDPTNCHRRLLVARVLEERGVEVTHIRGDGRTQPESELAELDGQQALFVEEQPWRSTQSVSRRPTRATSSAA